MGHVDHGKTTLLDAIRSSRITAKEKGGLTQHIGAYRVHTKHGDIVFLDTPGHESFTAMRSRGGKAADIVVLVVAADDGVMPQTIESINHCRVANVPIIVAINKIDLPGADPDAVKSQLAQQGVATNVWKEAVDFEEISAKEKVGIDEILERILILAEMMELKANPEGPASGLVVESRLDPRKGRLATLLVQEGTLRTGDIIVAGASSGKIRAMMDDCGQQVQEAGPSLPVEILGLTENLPSAGDLFHVCCSEIEARESASKSAKAFARPTEIHRASLEDLAAMQTQTKGPQEFKIILKTDATGSLEAIKDLLGRIKNPEVKLEIVHEGVGQVTDSDILLAQVSNCCIVGFNVPVMPGARDLAKRNNINIYTYDIIYRLQEEVEQAMQGILKPHKKENIVGSAHVRRLFHVPKVGVVLGCTVSSGKIVRNLRARIIHEGEIKGTGKITSLKHFKQDVREIKQGMECGIVVEGVKDIHPDDTIEEFEIVEIPVASS
jgi:translation initiation factor IF-2